MNRAEFITMLDTYGPTECPCCERLGAIYRNKLDQTIARMLIKLYKVSKKEYGHAMGYIHINRFGPNSNTRGRNFFMVKYWGLAETSGVSENDDKRASGEWRLTMDGIKFVRGKLRIPKYKWIFDDTILRDRETNPLVSIEDCFKERFLYSELIKVIDHDPVEN